MKITITAGNICTFPGDAIVNAANHEGLGGGGVDGAIHLAAGPHLLDACRALPTYPPEPGDMGRGMRPAKETRIRRGTAIPTTAGDLPCRWIIHTVGPVWPTPSSKVQRLDAEQALRTCYSSAATVAIGMGLRSLAYPAISAGVYGCPMETCARIALGWAADMAGWPIDVTFYVYPAEVNLDIWREVAHQGMTKDHWPDITITDWVG